MTTQPDISQAAPTTEKIADRNIRLYGLQEPKHLHGYQPADWEVVDYQQYHFPESKVFFRGPDYREALKSGKKKVAFIGAAQFFARFCPTPVSEMLAKEAGIAPLNFGYSGASPEFFLAMPQSFFDALNDCDLVILQAMSARASANAYLQAPNPVRPNNIKIKETGEVVFVNNAWKYLLDNVPARKLWQAILQTRSAYVKSMLALREKIKTKTVLFWFSEREMDYNFSSFNSFHDIMGSFPHFVTRSMVETLAPHFDTVLECVSTRGRPHQLVNRFDGSPAILFPEKADPTENYYYPTPEMQRDAADVLLPYLKVALV
ncbi:hypothetical protein SAMN04488038_102239 [Solimonas aquatica]|uniref:DUF6473 domain-containing protein n=1 Tax=Solimonas aquatica TaxID=489703 RepID=A0A1H9BV59_9GAMM|nr:DUF6473 family protein [Solimonas aquatica]SEP92824.1 hypothetical protein SAMN04488038_102239 [Solimonas aquatica]